MWTEVDNALARWKRCQKRLKDAARAEQDALRRLNEAKARAAEEPWEYVCRSRAGGEVVRAKSYPGQALCSFMQETSWQVKGNDRGGEYVFRRSGSFDPGFDPPEGFRFTGEVREAKKGDWIVASNNRVAPMPFQPHKSFELYLHDEPHGFTGPRYILEKL